MKPTGRLPRPARARPGRPADRVEAATAALRELIVGKLQPGDRLPSRREVQLSHGLAIATVQRAFDRLASDGFIRASGRDGTFVAERPPHLHRILVAFPFRPGDAGWVGMWTALTAAVAALPSGGSEIALLHGYEDDPAERDRLAAEVTGRRLAGLVFASDPWPLAGHPALTQPGLARAAIAPQARLGIPAVALGGDFVDRALDRAVARGGRRPAFITTPGQAAWSVAAWRKGVARHGLAYDEQLVQVVAHTEVRWVANLVRLLLRLPAGQRPDSLVVDDDNLAAGALAALADAATRLPLVLHGNFPLARPDPLPAERLGYDLDAALAACLDLIGRQRRGGRVPRLTPIPLRFADEPAPPRIP